MRVPSGYLQESRPASLAVEAVSCAVQLVPTRNGTVNDQGIVAGFWRGLWHGLIAPATFVLSPFSSGVRIYEVHNARWLI